MGLKIFFFTSLVLLVIFAGFFMIGVIFSIALEPANAQDFMPYEVIGPEDTFKLIISTDQAGRIAAFTYRYEYAD